MKLPSWPTMIVVIVTATFVAVVAFIFFTLGHRVELVTPDYYARSLTYQETIEGTRRAQALQPVPTLRVSGAQLRLTIPQHAGATGTLYFYRPSDARLDRELPLRLDGQGDQAVEVGGYARGPWRIQATWTHSNLNYRLENLIVF